MNTFQRDLLQGVKIQKEKSPNLQNRNKQSIKINKSQLYTQIESSCHNIKLTPRQLSLGDIKPDNDYEYDDNNNNINKLNFNSIKANSVRASKIILTPNQRSHFNTNPNANVNLPLSQSKTSMGKDNINPFS